MILLYSFTRRGMKSTFSWTNLFQSSTSSTLCFGERTLGKLHHVKLLCSPTPRALCDHSLRKLNQETEFCITMHIPPCVIHTGTTFSVPRSSSETDRVSNCNSSLVTTLSSRMIPGKLEIEVTKDPIHHVGKNGEHFYGENFKYEYPSKRHIKSNQHMGILHAFSKSNQHIGILHAFSISEKATFNHGLSPSEVD